MMSTRRRHQKDRKRRAPLRPLFCEKLENRLVLSTFTVNNLTDVDDQDSANGYSLREAIHAANSTPGDDAINFAGGLTGTINLTSSLPNLSSNVAVNGPGEGVLTVRRIDGATGFGIFAIDAGAHVAISGLTISNGLAVSGGGIFNDGGTVSVSNATISGNTARGIPGVDGAIRVVGGDGGIGAGGGIYSATGSLNLSNVSITNNLSVGGTGGVGGPGENTGCVAAGTCSGRQGGVGGFGIGGGIFVAGGSVSINSGTLSGNESKGGIGGVGGKAGFDASQSTVGTPGSGGQGGRGLGGALYLAAGTISLIGADISSHHASPGNGGDGGTDIVGTPGQPGPVGDASLGGAIYVAGGTMNLSDATQITAGNAAQGGGIYQDDGELVIESNTAVSANTASAEGGGIYVAGGQLELSEATVASNGATNSGGGIYVASNAAFSQPIIIANSLISGNTVSGSDEPLSSGYGGGIYNAGRSITISNSSFNDNVASGVNGITYQFSPGGDGTNAHGGGIYTAAGTLTITASTFARNEARGGRGGHGLTCQSSCPDGGQGGAAEGGAIYISGGNVQIELSTFSENLAIGGRGGDGGDHSPPLTFIGGDGGNGALGLGGAIYRLSGAVDIISTTIAENIATGGDGGDGGCSVVNGCTGTDGTNGDGRGGGLHIPTGTVSVRNTLIAINAASGGRPDISGGVTSTGYNLVGNGAGSTGFTNGTDLVGTSAFPIDPLIGPPQNNGGATFTHALQSGSPAIDQGISDNSATDQRGSPRPIDTSVPNAVGGDGTDIGAYEFFETVNPPLIVTTLADHNDGTCSVADCSLREAMIAAELETGKSTIEFAPGVAGTINLTSKLPDITTDIDIIGPGADVLTIRRDSGGDYRIFLVYSGTTSTISGLTITNGHPPIGHVGGAVFNGGTLTITGSYIHGSTAGEGFAGGGGVGNSGALTIVSSTIAGNVTASGGGGGIRNFDGAHLTLISSTVSANESATGGGGIYNDGTLVVESSTIFGDTAGEGGGIYNGSNGSATVRNSIVAKNLARTNPDVSGVTYVSQGYNLIGDVGNASGFTGAADQVGTSATPLDPLLGPLANNGGPTPTHALQKLSAAIDAGNSFGATTDQRGLPRPVDKRADDVGDGSDIGAYERVRQPELVLLGSGSGGFRSISDGDDSPSIEDGTDFETVTVTDPAVVHQFSFSNVGEFNVNLDDLPVRIVGQGAAAFSLEGITPTVVEPNVIEAAFQVRFQPMFGGEHNARVEVLSNDGESPIYDFAIRGIGGAVQLPAPLGVIGWWKADGNALDVTGSHDGAMTNGTYQPGLVEEAFDFDGLDDRVTVSGGGQISGSRTIEAWVFPRENSGRGMPILTGGVTNQGDFFGIAGTEGDFGQHDLYVDHWGVPGYDSNLAVTPNQWNHVALTYDGATMRAYLNGVPGDSLVLSLYPHAFDSLVIGGNTILGSTTKKSFNGRIDELTIYDRALSPAELQSIYEAGAAGKSIVKTFQTPNDVLIGSIDSTDLADWYVGQLAQGDTVSLRVGDPLQGRSMLYLPGVELLNDQFQVLASSLSHELMHSDEPLSVAVPADGIYYIRVLPENRVAPFTGSYEVHISVTSYDGNSESESNDSFASGDTLTSTNFRGGLANANDIDYFRFNASAGQAATVKFANLPAANPAVRLWDGQGNELAADLTGTGLDYVFGANGEFAISVAADNSLEEFTGQYVGSLRVSTDPTQEAVTSNGFIGAEEWNLVGGMQVTAVGTLANLGDIDVFQVDLDGTQTYEFRIDKSDVLNAQNRKLSLYNEFGQLVRYTTYYQTIRVGKRSGRHFVAIEALNETGIGGYAIQGTVTGQFPTQRDVPLYYHNYSDYSVQQQVPNFVSHFESRYDIYNVDVVTEDPGNVGERVNWTLRTSGCGGCGSGGEGNRRPQGDAFGRIGAQVEFARVPYGLIEHELGHGTGLPHLRHPLDFMAYSYDGQSDLIAIGSAYPQKDVVGGFGDNRIAFPEIWNQRDYLNWILTAGRFVSESETNDDRNSAQDLEPFFAEMTSDPDPRNDQVIVIGSIDTASDSDYFRFVAQANEDFAFDIESAEFQYPLDATVQLYDQNGNLLAASTDEIDWDSGIASADPFLVHRFQQTGTYYVRVTGSQRTTGAYRLKVAPQRTFDSDGPRVYAVWPDGGSTVDSTRQLIFWLNDQLDPASINASTLRIVGDSVGQRGGSAYFDPIDSTLTWTADLPLPSDNYTVTLSGGVDGIRDLYGNQLDGETDGDLQWPEVSGDGTSGGDFVTSFTVNAADTTAAQATSVIYRQHSANRGLFTIRFDDELDIRNLFATGMTVRGAGMDQTFDTVDDTFLLTDLLYQKRESQNQPVVELYTRGIPDSGLYRLEASLLDAAGNAVTLSQTVTISQPSIYHGPSVVDINVQPNATVTESPTAIEVSFNGKIDLTTLTVENFRLYQSLNPEFFDGDDQLVTDADGMIAWNPQTHRAILQPSTTLPNAYYLLELDGSPGGIKDVAGQLLDGDYLDANIAGSSLLTHWPDAPSGDGLPGGDYRAYFRVHADDPYEEDDTLGTAYNPGTNWEQTWLSSMGGLGIQSDQDWYRIDVSPGEERLIVDVRFAHANGDINVGVFNSTQLFAFSDSTDDNEFVNTTLPGPGTYYIAVLGANAGNSYDLWWDDVAKPTVTGESLNGNNNRSGVAALSLQFSQPVTVGSATSLSVFNHTTGGPIDISTATLQDNGTNQVTWDFAGISFPDGRYTTELPAADVTNAGGLPLAGTHTFEFFVLQGDVSGDGAVNFADFGAVGSNFDPLPGTTYRAGDANGDGLVNFADFGVIGANFNPLGLAGLSYDLGDAPQASSNYPTTLANDGAVHIIGSGLFLGSGVDSESDGQPHADALGDDNAGDDEDGVTFGGLTAGSSADVTVVAAVPSTAVLNAWIDFNADGDWSDSEEQIFKNKPLTDGTNALSFSIPAGAAEDTFARFRVTTSAGYSFTGLARDGEVEDYKINIGAASAPITPAGAFILADPRIVDVEYSASLVESVDRGQRSRNLLAERVTPIEYPRSRLPRRPSANPPLPPRPRTPASASVDPGLIDAVLEDGLFLDELTSGGARGRAVGRLHNPR